MPSVSQLRSGIAANLASIAGLRTAAIVPDQVNPPVAVILPDGITFDRTMRRGMDEYGYRVLLIVDRVDWRTGQQAMDAYCAPSGPSSVKAAIESDRTLGGAAQDLRVSEMRNYGTNQINGADYLTAEFVVTVYA